MSSSLSESSLSVEEAMRRLSSSSSLEEQKSSATLTLTVRVEKPLSFAQATHVRAVSGRRHHSKSAKRFKKQVIPKMQPSNADKMLPFM